MNTTRFWPLALRDDDDRPHLVPDEVQSLDPVARGYWLDEEVMAIAGIKSASVIMKMKWADAVRPSHIAIKPKGRKRAWSARNVLRATLIAEFAQDARVSFHTAARIVKTAGLDHVDRLMDVKGLMNEVERAIAIRQQSQCDIWFMPSDLEAHKRGTAIIVDDWRFVCWLEPDKPPVPLVRVGDIEASEPTVSGVVRPSMASHPVRLTIPVGRIILRFLDSLARKGA